MILFLSDWDRYPNAIPDTKTQNTSWLNMASILKMMGIANYAFLLALHEPRLQGIDPHSSNLTPTQVLMIQLELKNNPWYFFREYARIPNGNYPLKFEINRPVLALLWSMLVGISFGLVMPRQLGKSFAMYFFHLWLVDYRYRKSGTFILTKDAKLKKESITHMQMCRELYPELISPLIKHGNDKDVDNYDSITCNRWGNRITFDIGHAVLATANNVARGCTLPFIHSDETAWTINAQLSIPQMQFATGRARENAREFGIVNCDVYTTTAGFLDTEHGKYAYDLIMSGMYWNENLYDSLNAKDAQSIVLMNAPGKRCIINGTFNYRQAGKDDNWLKERMAGVTTDVETLENNFLNKWGKGALFTFLTKQQSEVISKGEMAPLHTSMGANKYLVGWYLRKYEINETLNSGYFAIGLDTSQAVGRDSNGLILVDLRNMAVIARSQINEANLFNYAMWIVDLLIQYPRVTLVIENKASGQSILDIIVHHLLANGMNPYKRIYNSIVDNSTGKETDKENFELIQRGWRETEVYEKFKDKFGISTNQEIRRLLYDVVIQSAVNSTGHLVRDPILAEELRGLITKKGRVNHAVKGHDDLVIGWLMTHYFVKHTRNLEYYGIDTNYVLSMVSDDGSMLSPAELKVKKITNSIKEEVIKLKDKIKSSTSLVDNMRDEMILKVKINELKKTGDVSISLDAVMKEIKDARGKTGIKETILDLQRKRGQWVGMRPV
jgi:hypothetical protein